MAVRFPELGFYTLPGRVTDPKPMLGEVKDAEAAGLGSVWISERQDVKEAATLSGAAGALTSELAIGVGVTNPNTRHIMLTAAIGSTMSALTGGRFALGLGRGFDSRCLFLARLSSTAWLGAVDRFRLEFCPGHKADNGLKIKRFHEVRSRGQLPTAPRLAPRTRWSRQR